MSTKKLTLLSVVLCCASWAVAQSTPSGGAVPPSGSASAGVRHRVRRQLRPPGTAPAGWNPTPQTTPQTPNRRIAFFVQRNSKYHRSGIDISRHTDSSVELRSPLPINPNTPNNPGGSPSGSPCGTLPGSANGTTGTRRMRDRRVRILELETARTVRHRTTRG